MATRSSPLSSGPRTQGPDDVSRGSARQHASYLAEMRRNDRAEREKYEAQMSDEGIDPETGDRPTRNTHSEHVFPALYNGTRKAAQSSVGGTIAGTALGAFGYFLGLAWVRGGAAGAKNWLKAKFVNVVPGSTTSLPVGTAKNTNTTTAGSSATAPATSTSGALS
jgi:predicted phage gp36 major capsid-like protein